jgi:hypothetical protein
VKEGLNRVHLFGTIYYRRIISLAVRTTRMWEYTGITNLDWVSTAAVTNDEVWSWLDVVLKVGNQQTVCGPQAFDKVHPPDLVSFSPLFLPAGPWASVVPNLALISRRG